MLELEPGLIIWTWISFIALLILLYKVALPPLLDAMQKREELVAQSLREAEDGRKKNAEALEHFQKKIKEANEAAQKIIDFARDEGNLQKREIVEKAGKEAERLMLQAKEEFQDEKEKVMRSIKKETIELVLLAAEKIIGRSVKKEDTAKIADELL
ncbi:MAG: F0F1 ATP synthase subunit B [Candidatus Margulisiibacteriota bacterium]|jgi:F-type H+-transporting ATPase subunit b